MQFLTFITIICRDGGVSKASALHFWLDFNGRLLKTPTLPRILILKTLTDFTEAFVCKRSKYGFFHPCRVFFFDLFAHRNATFEAEYFNDTENMLKLAGLDVHASSVDVVQHQRQVVFAQLWQVERCIILMCHGGQEQMLEEGADGGQNKSVCPS